MKISKRLLDLICVIPGLLILSPFCLIAALLIWLEDQGDVIFSQERIGLGGRSFQMLKFRSMVMNAEKLGGQITVGRDPRITKFGHFLRKSKIDELPQLINVLRGDMSLVGPRPEVPRYVALYTPDQRRVLEVLPGMTDPASIHYRDENDLLDRSDDPERTYVQEIMPHKIQLNLEYIVKANTLTDIFVIFRTFLRILV